MLGNQNGHKNRRIKRIAEGNKETRDTMCGNRLIPSLIGLKSVITIGVLYTGI